MAAFPKPCRTERRREQLASRRKVITLEQLEKQAVRRRDKRCRFPLCGCRLLKLRLEVSHNIHKGAGGNPAGDRSTTRTMILLCVHRHQDGAVSRHHGTLRVIPLTSQGCDGPVAWKVDLGRGHWFEAAREVRPGELEPLSEQQRAVLTHLATLGQ